MNTEQLNPLALNELMMNKNASVGESVRQMYFEQDYQMEQDDEDFIQHAINMQKRIHGDRKMNTSRVDWRCNWRRLSVTTEH
jgi:hypothetical protein